MLFPRQSLSITHLTRGEKRPMAPVVVGGWYRKQGHSSQSGDPAFILVELTHRHATLWYPNTHEGRRKHKRGGLGEQPIRRAFATLTAEAFEDRRRHLLYLGPAVVGADRARDAGGGDPPSEAARVEPPGTLGDGRPVQRPQRRARGPA